MLIIKNSDVHEKGVFSDIDIPTEEIVGIWASLLPIGRKLFQEGMSEVWYESQVLGRYANHSYDANTVPFIDGDYIFLKSKEIKANDEITADYTLLKDMIGYVTKF